MFFGHYKFLHYRISSQEIIARTLPENIYIARNKNQREFEKMIMRLCNPRIENREDLPRIDTLDARLISYSSPYHPPLSIE